MWKNLKGRHTRWDYSLRLETATSPRNLSQSVNWQLQLDLWSVRLAFVAKKWPVNQMRLVAAPSRSHLRVSFKSNMASTKQRELKQSKQHRKAATRMAILSRKSGK